jgi:hypothetical protein
MFKVDYKRWLHGPNIGEMEKNRKKLCCDNGMWLGKLKTFVFRLNLLAKSLCLNRF